MGLNPLFLASNRNALPASLGKLSSLVAAALGMHPSHLFWFFIGHSRKWKEMRRRYPTEHFPITKPQNRVSQFLNYRSTELQAIQRYRCLGQARRWLRYAPLVVFSWCVFVPILNDICVSFSLLPDRHFLVKCTLQRHRPFCAAENRKSRPNPGKEKRCTQ